MGGSGVKGLKIHVLASLENKNTTYKVIAFMRMHPNLGVPVSPSQDFFSVITHGTPTDFCRGIPAAGNWTHLNLFSEKRGMRFTNQRLLLV